MDVYDYLIVGGGMTAHAAVRGIREIDAVARIGLLTEEPCPPYRKPPLSKGLWKGMALDAIGYGTQSLKVKLHPYARGVALDPELHQVTDADGELYRYNKLLLATGGIPRRLPYESQSIVYFRNLADYQWLRARSGQGKRLAVIGGGFIGSEFAAALAEHGNEVLMIFPEPGIGARILPEDLSVFLNHYYEKHNVTVLAGHTVTRIEQRGERVVLGLRSVATGAESQQEADGVVAGLGILPADGLARQAGLTVSDGIEVDAFLRTSHPDIYAAGDVANVFCPALHKRVRVEHEDNALHMGRCAGRNMAGDAQPYRHLSYFYSDLFDLGYEAVGELDPLLDTFADWTVPHCKGVIYYRRDERVCGVLLWNVWERVPSARTLIESGQPIARSALNGLIG